MRVLAMVAAVGTAMAAEALVFNRDIRPILSDRCFGCHGPDATTKGVPLRLDQEAAARAAIEPGKLLDRITTASRARRMPPVSSGKTLSETEIATLRRWIEEGAHWQKHWSFLPPVRAPLPEVRRSDWARNAIDRYVLGRLEREGLAPSAPAAQHTLLRRVTFDLTGLPPTRAEVEAFQRDTSHDAYEKVVDRLLASPHFAERMASRWLDAARYADTNGYQTDAERIMWRWRDWVIDAFHRNQPFDRFLTEQLAGDLLPNATLAQKIATGFNRNHRGNSEGGIVPEEYLAEYAVDRVETASTVFLGLTLGCARCHNHKYDPFTQREFYQLFAYFNNVPELGRYLKYGNTPPYLTAPTAEQQQQLDKLERALQSARTRFAALDVEGGQRAWERKLARSAAWQIEEKLDASASPGPATANLGDKGDYGFFDKFSVSAWITAEAESGTIVNRAEDFGEAEGWAVVLVKGKLQVNLIKRRLDDSIRVETERALPMGRRTHLAIRYDGSRLASGVHVFVDGKREPVTIILDAINQEFRVKAPLRIGEGGLEPRFAGTIENVRVYGQALTDEEFAMLAVPGSVGEVAAKPAQQRTAAEAALLRRAYLETAAPAGIRQAWNETRQAERTRDAYVATLPTVMVMEEARPEKPAFVLDRGAYDRPRERVARLVPAALHPLPEGAPPNRLGLALWLTDRANPLTARVTVNRFWQMLFGVGLVKTTEDFGSQGEWPSHPELLDWLAVEFVESGWDVKRLFRTIVTSATYRQASNVSAELLARDPENRLLARGPRFRLPAEMIRDQALAASGLLVAKIGGPSVKPYQPAGLWGEIGNGDYVVDKGEGLYRRSLYTYWKRTAAPPYMATFDAALRESCTVRESRTNTPLQALNLMNDVTFLEASRKLAERVMLSEPEARRLEVMFQTVLSRTPRADELTRLRASLQYYRDRFSSAPEQARQFLEAGSSPREQRLAEADLAAYSAIASLLFNLDEALTKE